MGDHHQGIRSLGEVRAGITQGFAIKADLGFTVPEKYFVFPRLLGCGVGLTGVPDLNSQRPVIQRHVLSGLGIDHIPLLGVFELRRCHTHVECPISRQGRRVRANGIYSVDLGL